MSARLAGREQLKDIADQYFCWKLFKLGPPPHGFRLVPAKDAQDHESLRKLCHRNQIPYLQCLTGFYRDETGWHPVRQGLVVTLRDYKRYLHLIGPPQGTQLCLSLKTKR